MCTSVDTTIGTSVSLEKIMSELRKHSFGIIGTVSKDGRPHATGVSYSMSILGKPLALYIMSDTGTKKVRNILRDPNVSFVVPIPRPLLTSAPMSCIQFQGKADVLKSDDEGATKSLKSTRIGRMMLNMMQKMNVEKDRELCFIMVTPDSIIYTYGVGMSLLQMRSRMG